MSFSVVLKFTMQASKQYFPLITHWKERLRQTATILCIAGNDDFVYSTTCWGDTNKGRDDIDQENKPVLG